MQEAVEELPCTRVYVNTGDPIEAENLMEFRLLYEGLLPPCTNTKRRAAEKHEIRKVFHPQLRRLWQARANLRYLADRFFVRAIEEDKAHIAAVLGAHEPPVTLDKQQRIDAGLGAAGRRFSRAGYQIVPLVTEELALQCSLDILLLRPREKRLIFEQGDIDGQVKTLFDALRMPTDTGETGGAIPEPDENPLFCLLQDDKLISEVKVTADELLMLPNQREVKANDSLVVIHVRLNHRDPRTFDNYFG